MIKADDRADSTKQAVDLRYGIRATPGNVVLRMARGGRWWQYRGNKKTSVRAHSRYGGQQKGEAPAPLPGSFSEKHFQSEQDPGYFFKIIALWESDLGGQFKEEPLPPEAVAVSDP